jgi:cyclopropane fatty-acyl-phospholipid synthase-like methyltransferase
MPPNLELAREYLKNPRYPRTCKYEPKWQVELEMGCPTFSLLENLCDVMELKPDMRVLDLGCGNAGGSIFLAKEYGLQVWAVDMTVRPTENWERIRKAGVEQVVFPLRAEAHEIPFPMEFFDAIIAINSLWYFVTGDTYLTWYLLPLLKPGSQLGIVAPGFYSEIAGNYPNHIPEHLKPYWDSCSLSAWHSADWWREHLRKTNQLEVHLADNFPDDEGYQTYLRWERIIEYPEKIAEDDAGRTITFVRLVARKKPVDKE